MIVFLLVGATVLRAERCLPSNDRRTYFIWEKKYQIVFLRTNLHDSRLTSATALNPNALIRMEAVCRVCLDRSSHTYREIGTSTNKCLIANMQTDYVSKR